MVASKSFGLLDLNFPLARRLSLLNQNNLSAKRTNGATQKDVRVVEAKIEFLELLLAHSDLVLEVLRNVSLEAFSHIFFDHVVDLRGDFFLNCIVSQT